MLFVASISVEVSAHKDYSGTLVLAVNASTADKAFSKIENMIKKKYSTKSLYNSGTGKIDIHLEGIVVTPKIPNIPVELFSNLKCHQEGIEYPSILKRYTGNNIIPIATSQALMSYEYGKDAEYYDIQLAA